MIKPKKTDVLYNMQCHRGSIGTGFRSASVEEAVLRANAYRKFFHIESMTVTVFDTEGRVLLSKELNKESRLELPKTENVCQGFYY